MPISLMVATAKNGVIGKDGGLPWQLPAELARFKRITMGRPIIMGRRTHESIGRTLPGRLNIVISRNPGYKAADGCLVVGSLDKALEVSGEGEVFVIGGETVFAEALPKADTIYLTLVDADIDGDRHFRFDESQWERVSVEPHPKDSQNPYDFEFTVLKRKRV